MLVKALENIIVPIVNSYFPGSDAAREYQAQNLETEAQQLVSALENFIDAFVRPQLFERQNAVKGDELNIFSGIAEPRILDRDFSMTSVFPIRTRIPSEQPRILRLALKQARHHVFNKMPIRLLAFKSDGCNIELIERSAILNRISTAMESEFEETIVQAEFNNSEADNEDILAEMLVARYAKYVILSHTWLHDLPGEVTYADWKTGQFDKHSSGYDKLANFCRVAAKEHGATFGWMDTICINKESSSELDESIRSMYSWYQGASVCVTYLAKTTALSLMRADPWFTRGWTLQELLAPKVVEFYAADWQELGAELSNNERTRLIDIEIKAATTITQQNLHAFKEKHTSIPISLRMKWAANRQVTREEDVAYSLMGIFDVSMSIAYGEGAERAFIRLMKEILSQPGSGTLDLLNWGHGPNVREHELNSISSLISWSPRQYLWRANTDPKWAPPRIPLILTHLGLHISVLVLPASPNNGNNWIPVGSFYATVNNVDAVYANDQPPTQKYNILDKTACNDSWGSHLAFGVLNIRESEDRIFFPHPYGRAKFSVCFSFYGILNKGPTLPNKFRRVPTSSPIIFEFEGFPSDAKRGIPKSDLSKHGMQLVTGYL